MLHDPGLMQRWALTLVDYAVDLRADQVVAITGGVAAEPLLRAVYHAVTERNAYPVLIPTFPDLVAERSSTQLEFISPIERFIREQADAVISVLATTNTRSHFAIDAHRRTITSRAREALVRTFLERSASGDLKWVVTLYPTDAYAQEANMATAAFAELLITACKLDLPDPVGAWRETGRMRQQLIAWLFGKRRVQLTGLETDLALSVEGRRWINAAGHRNLPDGKIITAPIENSATGHIRISYPLIVSGHEINSIRLRFVDGSVVDASAETEEAFLHSLLNTDSGARVLGQFALGTNFGIPRFTRNPMLDDKIGGTVYLGLGLGWPETGSTNRSSIHVGLCWDPHGEGRVMVDGQLLLEGRHYVV